MTWTGAGAFAGTIMESRHCDRWTPQIRHAALTYLHEPGGRREVVAVVGPVEERRGDPVLDAGTI